jgi:peptidoglycan hydrolase CwlO-like protein
MKKESQLEKMSISVTKWIGTTQSIIVHSILFIVIFGLYFIGFALDQILLILTTAVSLEAIYLALFIQMTVNRNTQDIVEVASDIDQIQEDVEELGGDFDDIQEDVEDLESNLKKIHTGVEGIEDDVEEISSDIDKLQTPKNGGSHKIPTSSLQEELREITTHLAKLEQQIKKIQSS